MKAFLIISIFIFTFTGNAFSYPENQMSDCISSALNNPATKSIDENSIYEYCDCALTAIIDEGKDIRESGYECALKSFK